VPLALQEPIKRRQEAPSAKFVILDNFRAPKQKNARIVLQGSLNLTNLMPKPCLLHSPTERKLLSIVMEPSVVLVCLATLRTPKDQQSARHALLANIARILVLVAALNVLAGNLQRVQGAANAKVAKQANIRIQILEETAKNAQLENFSLAQVPRDVKNVPQEKCHLWLDMHIVSNVLVPRLLPQTTPIVLLAEKVSITPKVVASV